MAVKTIDQADWSTYFDALSRKIMRGQELDYVEIRILSPGLGMQQETQWLPLAGITYDRRDDVLQVLVENLDHRIYHPVTITVDELGDGVIGRLEITRVDGTRDVLELR